MRTNEIICEYRTANTQGQLFCKKFWTKMYDQPYCSDTKARSCPYAQFADDKVEQDIVFIRK